MSSHFLIVLTKLGILKWKKREYIENLIFEGCVKYISFLFGKELRLIKTSIIFPNSCYLDINIDGVYQYRFNNMRKLYEFLETQKNLKLWIPDDVIKDSRRWLDKKRAIKIIRKIKIGEINENCRES